MADPAEQKPKYAIPIEFEGQLRFRPCKDLRSDAEIIDALAGHHPVVSEKNVWAYWHAGVRAMPGWCQRNVITWVRMNEADGWTVRVLDSKPDSPNYAVKWLSRDMLPEAFVKGTMDGPYVGPHSADFLRGACLYQYGGIYMDVGNVLVRELDRICWKQLDEPESPYQICVPLMYGTTVANHFTASRKHNPMIERWHKLFTHVWENRTNHVGLVENPLFAPLQDAMTFDNARASKLNWDFKVPAKTVMEYITQVLCWQRLCLLEGTDSDPFSGVDYWTKHVLLYDVLEEDWGGEAVLGFKNFGERACQLLSLSLHTDPASADHRDAYRLVWHLLTQCSKQKITHGKGLTHDVMLGVLWDEVDGRDNTPDTFADLLRYGSLNFTQTRETIKFMEAPRPSKTLKKGLLEP